MVLYITPIVKRFVSVLCHCDKILENNNVKRKGSFWFMISEVSIYGHLAALLLGMWHDRNIMVDGCNGGKLLTSQWTRRREGGRKKRERPEEKGARDKI